MSSSHHLKRPRPTDDTQEARLVAVQRFVKGDRVRHRTTGKMGSFVEKNSGFALLEVWVQFDSETEIQVPISCNPLELELVAPDYDVKVSALLELNKVIAPEIVEDLTEQEERDLHRLELRVERAFYEAGKALAELRERRLYRSSYKTFEAYCRERFGFTRQAANYLIAGANIFENLTTNGCQTLPTNERQVRSLFALLPEQQCQVWQQAVEASNGKLPSGRVVKGIVEQLKEKPLFLAKDFCQVGEVFTLVRLSGKEKKYNGCSCVAVEAKDFTVLVDVHDITLAVKSENLDKIDSPDVQRQLPQILQRIRRVREVPGLRERIVYTMLEHLGKQTYLTPLENKILQMIEQEYGVENVDD